MSKKNKILMGVLCILLAGVLVFELGVYIKRRNQKPVNVYNIEDCWLYTTVTQDMTSYGFVTSDSLQTVYLSDTQEVTGVLVQEGQAIQVGQPLLAYDTTLSQLTLNRKKLDIEKMKMRLTDAQAQLEEIKKLKPIVYQPGTDPEPTTPEFVGSLGNQVFRILELGRGTQVSPMVLWAREDLAFDNYVFWAIFKAYSDYSAANTICVVVETRENDLGDGEITSRTGLVLTREPKPTQPQPTEPDPTEPDPTEPDPTEPDPSEPIETRPQDPTEPDPTEPDPTEPGNPVNPANSGAQSMAMRDSVEDYDYYFRFFMPGDDAEGQMPSGPSLDINSGYTASQIAEMRADMEAQIKEMKFNLKMAEAEYSIMQKEFDTGSVLSDVAGYVVSVIPPAQALATGEPVIRISDGGGFLIEGTVSELNREHLAVGQQVLVQDWQSGGEYTGIITEIGDMPVSNNDYAATDGNPNVSYYPVYVSVDGSANLRTGGYYVNLTYEQRESDQLYLDTAFLLTEQGASYVYVQGADGLLEKRQVVTGKTVYDGSYVEVVSGLRLSDFVAFPYGKDVKAGAQTVASTTDELYGTSY